MLKKMRAIAVLVLSLSLLSVAFGQSGKGVITGDVKDAAGASLHGAKV
jgi:hypothetical protein